MSEPESLPPLSGVRVLEWAEGIPGPTAGWLLAEAGADVLKVERPEGDRLRGQLGFHVLNRGKRGLVVDLEDDQGREKLRRLLAAADVVVVDETEPRLERFGLGYDPKRWPSLVWCSVPMFPRDSFFGGMPPVDDLAAAVSGISAMQWSYSGTPVCLVTPMVSYASGFLAALGAAAALRARASTGRGQRVDSSGLAAAMLLQTGTYVRGPGHQGSLASQANDPRGVFPTYGLYQTADGWLFVGALTEPFWVSLATLVGRTDWLTDPELVGSPMSFGRAEVRERLRRELEPIFRGATTAEWLRRFSEADIPGGRVQSRREFLDEPTAAAIGAVIEIDDPEVGAVRQLERPVIFEGVSWKPPAPAPDLDPDRDSGFGPRAGGGGNPRGHLAQPLEGLRVLDLTSFIAGPLCPMLLADLGADVVKIETASGDPFRVALYGFEGWNRGKRSLVLDLKSAAGKQAFLRLVDKADAVIENFRNGVMDRLGVGWGILSARNPLLVYTAISGFGSTGPEAGRPGFDPVMQARSGFSRAQGGSDEPVLHQVAYTDYMTGTLGAFATAAALLERQRTRRGRRVEVSLYRTAFAMQAGEIVECAGSMPEVEGGRDLLGRSAVYRAYRARDGWIFIAASEPQHAEALADVLGLDGNAESLLRSGVSSPVAEQLAEAIARCGREALIARLRAAAVPAAPCLTFDEVLDDPRIRASRLMVDIAHPRLERISQTGEILRFSLTPMLPPQPAPGLGEHGREVLTEAGFSPAEIETLVATGVTRAGS